MSVEWKSIIPETLHAAFSRQIEEAVSAELMELLRNADDAPSHDNVDPEDLKDDLAASFELKFLQRFKDSTWPPEASALLGVNPTEQKLGNNWVCTSCRERNSNAFETCQKCSESRPDSAIRSGAAPMQSVIEKPRSVVPVPTILTTWNCRDCGAQFPTSQAECTTCLEPLDPNKRHSWPSVKDVPDPAQRKALRLKLFQAMREELDMDDPFSSLEISHEDFFLVAETLKARLLISINPRPSEIEISS